MQYISNLIQFNCIKEEKVVLLAKTWSPILETKVQTPQLTYTQSTPIC